MKRLVLFLEGEGDAERFQGQAFCAAMAAAALAAAAREAGAGSVFSLAVAIALREFESWLIAGIQSLDGKQLPDGRRIGLLPPALPENPEAAPRDAKGWLKDVIAGGYRESRDQLAVTSLIELRAIRERGLRSFRRLEHAINQLVDSIRAGQPVTTPPGAPPPTPSPLC